MTSCVIICDDISAKNYYASKLCIIKRNFKLFVMNMTYFFNLVMRKISFNINFSLQSYLFLVFNNFYIICHHD